MGSQQHDRGQGNLGDGHHADRLDEAVTTTDRYTQRAIAAQRAVKHDWALVYLGLRGGLKKTKAVDKSYSGMLSVLEDELGVDAENSAWAAAHRQLDGTIVVRTSERGAALAQEATDHLMRL